MHQPLERGFNEILAAVAKSGGKGVGMVKGQGEPSAMSGRRVEEGRPSSKVAEDQPGHPADRS